MILFGLSSVVRSIVGACAADNVRFGFLPRVGHPDVGVF